MSIASRLFDTLIPDAAKRALVTEVLSKALGFDFRQIGEVVAFELDLTEGSLRATLNLQGETKALAINELRFRQVDETIEIFKVKTDRAWLDAICQQSLPLSFNVPPAVGSLLKTLT